MATSTSTFEVVILIGFVGTMLSGGSVQFLMTVKDALVLNAVPLGSIRTRTTFGVQEIKFHDGGLRR